MDACNVSSPLRQLVDNIYFIQQTSLQMSDNSLSVSEAAELHTLWYSRVMVQIRACYAEAKYKYPSAGGTNPDISIIESLRRTLNPLRQSLGCNTHTADLHAARRADEQWKKSRNSERFVALAFRKNVFAINPCLQKIEKALIDTLEQLRTQGASKAPPSITIAPIQPALVPLDRNNLLDAKELRLRAWEGALKSEAKRFTRERADFRAQMDHNRNSAAARDISSDHRGKPEATAIEMQKMFKSLRVHPVVKAVNIANSDLKPTAERPAERANLPKRSGAMVDSLELCEKDSTESGREEGGVPIPNIGYPESLTRTTEDRKYGANHCPSVNEAPPKEWSDKSHPRLLKGCTHDAIQHSQKRSQPQKENLDPAGCTTAKAGSKTDFLKVVDIFQQVHEQDMKELCVAKKDLEQCRGSYNILKEHLSALIKSRMQDMENVKYYLLDRPDCNCTEHSVLKQLYHGRE